MRCSVDLTHPLNNRTPVYPGTTSPIFSDLATIDSDGFAEKEMTLVTHTGTHIDAPGHMVCGGKTLDQYSIDKYFGDAIVIAVPENTKTICQDLLESKSTQINDSDFVIFKSGWSAKWESPEFFEGFPVLSSSAAQFLTRSNLKGVGLDMISVDPVGSTEFPNHQLLLGADLIIVENLTNLDELPENGFRFFCIPLNIEDADGSPVRAFAEFET